MTNHLDNKDPYFKYQLIECVSKVADYQILPTPVNKLLFHDIALHTTFCMKGSERDLMLKYIDTASIKANINLDSEVNYLIRHERLEADHRRTGALLRAIENSFDDMLSEVDSDENVWWQYTYLFIEALKHSSGSSSCAVLDLFAVYISYFDDPDNDFWNSAYEFIRYAFFRGYRIQRYRQNDHNFISYTYVSNIIRSITV